MFDASDIAQVIQRYAKAKVPVSVRLTKVEAELVRLYLKSKAELAVLDSITKENPDAADQPRDESGMWTGGGGAGRALSAFDMAEKIDGMSGKLGGGYTYTVAADRIGETGMKANVEVGMKGMATATGKVEVIPQKDDFKATLTRRIRGEDKVILTRNIGVTAGKEPNEGEMKSFITDGAKRLSGRG